MRTFITVIVIAALAVLALLYFKGENQTATINTTGSPTPTATTPRATLSPTMTTSPTPGPEVFELNAVASSSEKGKVTLTPTLAGKVQVSIKLDKDASVQSAHIRSGTCKNLGAVKYSLNSLVNGKSETTLNTSLAQLILQIPLALDVHKSASQTSTVAACADLIF